MKGAKLTSNEGDRSRTSIVPGMAYFANTGPAHSFCYQCRSYNNGERPLPRGRFGLTLQQACAKFTVIAGHGGPKFDGGTASCKYFVEL